MLNGGRVARFRGEPRETHTGVHARTHTPTYIDMMDHKGQRGDRGQLCTECFAWVFLPIVGPFLMNRI